MLLTLFWTFFKIGLFTIGGGYAMLPLMREEIVGNGYLEDTIFVNMLAVSEATPGPVAVNMATFAGMQLGYMSGGAGLAYLYAAVCTLGVVLPAFIIMLIVSRLLLRFSQNFVVVGALSFVRPAVIGLIASAFIGILCTVILPKLALSQITKEGFSDFNGISVLLFVGFFALSRIRIRGKTLHPILLIALSAVVGILLYGIIGI